MRSLHGCGQQQYITWRHSACLCMRAWWESLLALLTPQAGAVPILAERRHLLGCKQTKATLFRLVEKVECYTKKRHVVRHWDNSALKCLLPFTSRPSRGNCNSSAYCTTPHKHVNVHTVRGCNGHIFQEAGRAHSCLETRKAKFCFRWGKCLSKPKA